MVQITGRNFRSRVISCRFGDLVVEAIPVSSEMLKCASPPNYRAQTLVSVDVSTNGQDYTVSGVEYEYVHLPHIVSTYPEKASGLVEGNAEYGIAFNSTKVTQCRFGVSSVSRGGHVSASGVLSCARERRSHAMNRRLRVLSAMNAGIDASAQGSAFIEFQREAVPARLRPDTGPSAGGVDVIINGHNFTL